MAKLIDSFFKSKDASGHEHGADGRFESAGGSAPIYPKQGQDGARYVRESRKDGKKSWALFQHVDGKYRRIGTAKTAREKNEHLFHGYKPDVDRYTEADEARDKHWQELTSKWSSKDGELGKFLHADDLLPLLRKKRTLASIVPPSPASRMRKVMDDSGHEHGKDGKFVSQGEAHAGAKAALAQHYGSGGNAASNPSAPDAGMDSASRAHVDGLLAEAGSAMSGKSKTPKQRIEDKHTDAKTGAVDYDSSVAERRQKGHLGPGSTTVPEAVFNIGGGGVGKGSMTQELVGNGGEKDRAGNIIGPGHPEYKAPQPGFHPSRVFDADAEKKLMPLYSDQTGEKPNGEKSDDPTMYGASGPKTGAEFAKYSPEEQEAMHAYVRKTTKFKDAHDFARSTINGPRNPQAAAAGDLSHGHFNDGTAGDTEFDGGLTHELSSHIVKNKLMHALAHPEEGSFVYDSVGNEKYKGWAAEARKNGFRSRFREAVLHPPTDKKTGAGLEIARPEVGQYRNQGRPRTVDPKLLAGTHRKAAIISPILNAHSRELEASGERGHTHDHIPTMSDEDVAEALNAGMTPDGPPAGFEHPKKKARRLAAEAAKGAAA